MANDDNDGLHLDPQTRALVRIAAREVADAAVKQALTSLGVDASSPLEMQKDMAALREMRALISDEEFRRDMVHLRKWRKAVDTTTSGGLKAAVGVIVTGMLAALWLGFAALLGNGGQGPQ